MLDLDLDYDDPITSEAHVLGVCHEREIAGGLYSNVLVVETDLELGPRQGTQGDADIKRLIEACHKRMKQTGIGINKIRLVRRTA